MMDHNRVKGTVDEVVGIAKQKAGKLTGNSQLRVKGIAQEFKGKVEGAWGQAKEAARESNQKTVKPPASDV
jgi:uncharacterized protein YjbJ (UPF0337 family)